ncbi:class I SAM-dependent methyltransferase [Rubritalea sp.]|uniref:class I SAM-dependent methyltransferase n=1 Tax=Rubritalea sp. TaxID=2109375 RepID=UPI003EF3B2F7
MQPNAKVLLVGGGDGRFLEGMLGRLGDVDIDYVEPSGAMLVLAKKRVSSDSRVSWCQSSIEDWRGGAYDLIVAHFVLDAFEPSSRSRVIEALVGKVVAKGEIVVSDFSRPVDRVSQVLMWLMQWFFYVLVKHPMWEVRKDDTPFFENGAELSCEESWNKGWIYSQIWKI